MNRGVGVVRLLKSLHRAEAKENFETFIWRVASFCHLLVQNQVSKHMFSISKLREAQNCRDKKNFHFLFCFPCFEW